MSRARPDSWPPRPASRALPPGPRQDVFALIDRYAPVIATWPAYDRWRVRQIAVDTLLQAMRDCPEPAVRANAYQQLVKMGIAQPC